MSMGYGPIADRAMSTYALSIGTSYAFEAIEKGPQDPYPAPGREEPEQIDIDSTDELWVNLLTLARNMFSSIARSDLQSVRSEDLADALVFEVDVIREMMKKYHWVTLRFYSCNYSGMRKRYPQAKIRGETTPSTPLQKHHNILLSKTISEYYKRVKSSDRLHFAHEISAVERKRAIILSSYAYDLLSYPGFESLKLLESHTGRLKDRSLWYTKFEDKDCVRIPFSRLMIQIFGDKTNFFQHDAKIRAAIKELAEEYKWNFATTPARVNTCLGFMKDVYTAKMLRAMS